MVAGHEVVCPCTLIITDTIARGAMVQPMRKPVMAYSLETPLITMTLEFSRSSLAHW